MKWRLFFILFFLFGILTDKVVFGQACDPTTPSFVVDLSSDPDSVWISPVVQRSGLCCSAQSPDRCIEFIITLHPSVGGIYLDIYSGAKPSGSMFYMLDCDSTTLTAVGDSMCINGPGPHRITFCKPGNNNNEYIISGIGAGNISPPIIVSEACSDTLYSTGFIDSTIVWTSIPSDPILESFLNCTIGCDTVIVTPSGVFPDSIMYKVCGEISGLGCNTAGLKCDSTWVYFINNLDVQISPQNPSICFGGSSINLTTTVSGGSPPYSYLWSNGAVTDSITVNSGSGGVYWVDVTDETGCPAAQDTVNVLEFTSVITANAGVDTTFCSNISNIPLSGSVTGVSTGSWLGGNGLYNPSPDSIITTYTPTSAEITSGSVSLGFTTTNTGICPADTDSVTIYFDVLPTLDAGADGIICIDSSGFNLANATSSTNNVIWSNTGSGSFSPSPNVINPTYIPGGEETDTLILSSLDACSVTDTVIFQVTIGPIANAGSDTVVCATSTSIPLSGSITVINSGTWTTSGTGSFSPNDSSLNATYIPSALDTTVGLVWIILTPDSIGSCIVPDTLLISFTPNNITVNAGPDTMVCKDSPSIPLSGQVTTATGGTWTTSGTGTFSPSNDSLITNYIPSSSDTSAGSITLTLTSTGNGGCGGISDEIIIGFLPGIPVDAGLDSVLCNNVDTFNLNGFISGNGSGYWTSTGSGVFYPSDSSLTTGYVFTNDDLLNGTVTFILTANIGGFCAATDTLLVTIIPNANAGPDQYVCISEDTLLLSGSVGGATGGIWECVPPCTGTFFPDDTSLTTQYVLSSADSMAGSVTFVLSSTGNMMGCPTASDTMIASIIPPPLIDAGPDTIFLCSGNPEVELNGMVTNALGGVWSSSGSGIFNPSEDSLTTTYTISNGDIVSGTVTLTLTTNGSCIIVEDSVILSIIPGPDADFNFIEACDGDSIAFADNSVGITSGYFWDFGDGDTSNITPVSHLYGSFGTFDVTYVVISPNGCIDSITKSIIVHPVPSADFSTTAECMVDSAIFTDLSTIAFDTINSWEWDFGDGSGSTLQNPNHLYTNESTYQVSLVVTSSFGCVDSITRTLGVAAGPNADFAFSQNCFPDPVYFTDQSTIDSSINPHQIESWLWDFGNGFSDTTQSPIHYYSNPGSYLVSLIVTSDNGCTDTISDSIVLYQKPIAAFSFNHVCEIDTAVFTDSSQFFNSDSIESWIWNFGDGGVDSSQHTSHYYSNFGAYIVELVVTTINGCKDTMQQLLVVSPNPNASFSANSYIVSTEDIISLTDESTGSDAQPDTVNITSWLWDFYYPAAGSMDSMSTFPSPSIQYNDTGFYTIHLIVTNEYGCQDTTEQLFQVGLNPIVPTGFSPDGNGQNDILYVEGGPYLELSFSIYNNWGEQIFHSNNQERGWDGKHNGIPQPIGVYVYTVDAITLNNTAFKLWGNVTLLR